MATTFRIKDFPEELHKEAKILAVSEGVTLHQFILEAVRDKVEALKADKPAKRGRK